MSRTRIPGVILAGGRATRMGGGDKPLMRLGGRPLLSHVIERAECQVSELLLNANGDLHRFDSFGLDVIEDVVSGFAGPLAGVLTAMEWVSAHRPDARHIATFAVDTPFFPTDLVARFQYALETQKAELACASSGGRNHLIFGLWPVALRHDLRAALVDDGIRKVGQWTARHVLAQVNYENRPFDPFFNINTEADLLAAARMMAMQVTC